MKFKVLIPLCISFLIFSPIVFSQSKETGAIVGTVTDEEETPLPGVAVTLTSPKIMGARTVVTDAQGQYRFPALPPGTYSVKAELEGFATAVRENIRLHTTLRLTVDLVMKLATMEEEVTVIAQSPTVDVKTSETASVTLSDEILRAMPTSQFVTQIVNLAPGVTQDVAYGAASDTGISYQVDGVDVSDPEAGSAWVFLDYNILEEAKIMGIGLPAEYGAFTGVIFNTITKSGGNELSGHAEFIYQHTEKGLWTAENNQKYLKDFPDLESPINGMFDLSGHLGGPIQKDKVWFFTGAQYYRSKNRPAGFPAPHFRDYKQPRFFLKITSQPSSNINLTSFYEFDAYNGINRRASATHPPETCVSQESPDHVGNFDLTAILSPKTFANIKGAFFIGYYYLDPNSGMDTTAYWSTEDDQWYYNSDWWYKADRKRYQANANISHYAEDFIQGNHDFKFGVEFEYGWAKSRFGFTGYLEGIGSSVYIYDWFGYLYAYQYEGYHLESNYIRNEYYVQDAWSITDNFTLNLGARFSLLRGYVKDVSGAVYSTERIAPRLGFAWDIFGDHTTVLKAHYGHFTEALFTAFFDRLRPDAISPFIGYYEWGGEWYEWRRWLDYYTIADNIKHPYLEQFTVGIERELFRDASIGVSFIHRKWKSMLGLTQPEAEYATMTLNDPWSDDTHQVYDQTNYSPTRNLIVTNYKKGDPWILLDPYRKYWGIEVLFTKRFSNRWQLIGSYLYSQSTGTIDTGFGVDFGIGWAGAIYDPNYWINQEGHSTVDPTHMLKLQGTYILPFDIHFNASFHYITGNTYTRLIRPRLSQGRRYINTVERGSLRYPDTWGLDLRLEKTFMIAEKYRIGLMMDIFNVFNDDTITDWGTRVDYNWNPHEFDPAAPGPDGHTVYDLVDPRAIRLGIRFFF